MENTDPDLEFGDSYFFESAIPGHIPNSQIAAPAILCPRKLHKFPQGNTLPVRFVG